MGALLSAIFRRFSSAESESKIVIVGLSNAGKTTILYRLNLGTVVVTQPTIGSNVEELTHRNIKFQVRSFVPRILFFPLKGTRNDYKGLLIVYQRTNSIS